MKFTSNLLQEKIDYKALVSRLRSAFSSYDYTVPLRQHYDVNEENLSLIMPAWNKKYYGIKQILVCPENKRANLPTIQGKYDLFSAINGEHLAEIHAPKLTAIRTAATSVLASSFFAHHPKKLLIMGNGVIGKHLEAAYNDYYDLDQTLIWSRSENAKIDLKKAVENADIISCATLAKEPILFGKWITGNQHIDLIGSYKPDMREADNETLLKSDVYIDDWHALQESGELAIPIAHGHFSKDEIKGTLFDLCQNKIQALTSTKPSLFKSVGHAIEDLAAAIYFYESYF